MHYNVDRSYTCILYTTNRHPFRYRAVAIMFMIGALLMLLTTVAFMIGGNFEKICQTFLDMSIFRDVIFSVIILPYCNFSLLHFWKWKYLYLRCKQISINNTEKKVCILMTVFRGKIYQSFLAFVFQDVKTIEMIVLWLQFVDDGGVPGFNLGQMILNDPAANISLYGTLLSVHAYIVVF